jgi:2-polyprenyl-3-methyl-5-hydroxy-6-metoxy-1,4-benzoquinol methylase
MQILDKSNNAFQLTVQDPAMRFYLQRFPFLMGPDKTMNVLGRQVIYDGLALRDRQRVETVVHRLMPEEAQLTAEQMGRLLRIMDEAGIPQAVRAEMIDDYGWEASLVPLDTKDALVLGCADGRELMFLRAVLPDANITALDYEDQIVEAHKQAIGVRFFQGDMNALLDNFGQEFDLISSNHTLEHLYSPNEVLTTLAGMLRQPGALISTLPMDGMNGSPFLEKVKAAARRKTAHALDTVYLDAGHPWKTNPTDLNATFQEVGFEPPLLFQRQLHLSRYASFGEKRFKAQLALGRVLHAFFFGWPRSIAKVLLSKNPPRLFSRVLLGLERRVWFGSNNLKNRYTQEVLVLARKNSNAP